MTGPEHYREAERLLKAAAYDTKESALDSRDAERDADFLRAAQAHATLALAAATAFGMGRADDHGMLSEDANGWLGVASASEYGDRKAVQR